MINENEKVVNLERNNELSPRLALLYSMMEKTRKHLLRRVDDISIDAIDYTPNPRMIESIGTLLLHIAAVENDWIFGDIAGKEFGDEEWFDYAFSLRLKIDQIQGESIEFYLDKLKNVRLKVFDYLKTLNDEILDSIIEVESDRVSVEWVLFHLIEHEAMHIGQISVLKRLWKTHQSH